MVMESADTDSGTNEEQADTTLKDPRLHALVNSIRGALRRGFTNRKMKTVTYDIVNVVQTTGLCPKHSLSLNVLAAYLLFVFKS